jgi:hypothetical protein
MGFDEYHLSLGSCAFCPVYADRLWTTIRLGIPRGILPLPPAGGPASTDDLVSWQILIPKQNKL